MVEATLEHPTRFVAVPFEKVVDSYIKSKREEVDLIEETKKDLFSDWNKISQTELESSPEKFSVIEGEKKIFQKISQMIKETSREFVTISRVYGLVRADQYGIFKDITDHPLKNKIKFRFLTQVTKEDLKAIKIVLKNLGSDSNVRGRDPERNSAILPRIVIKDKNEMLLFISDDRNPSSREKIERTLCTNCQSLIESFHGVFNDLWNQSSNINERIAELERGKPSSKMEVIKDPETAKKIFGNALNQAKEEILIVTSPKRLIELSKNDGLIKSWCKRGVPIKIMAPITVENLKATHKLLSCSEVRHLPVGYFETTIIDGNRLFQFKQDSKKGGGSVKHKFFENTFYTNDLDYIERTRNLLQDFWKKTHTPSFENVRELSINITDSQEKQRTLERTTVFMQGMEYEPSSRISEVVLKKIEEEQKNEYLKRSKDWSSTLKYFGNRAFAAIKPPKEFGLPDMIIALFNITEKSSFGAEKWIVVNLLDEKTRNSKYVPVAFVQNNPQMLNFRKKVFEGFPLVENMHAFNNEQVQMQIKGNTFVAGWTRPIPLGDKYEPLPPLYLLFEGYGDVKSGMFTNITLSGRKQEVWYNSYDSFVNVYHPKSKYVGAGTEAFIEKDTLFISHPPNRKK